MSFRAGVYLFVEHGPSDSEISDQLCLWLRRVHRVQFCTGVIVEVVLWNPWIGWLPTRR